jgi:hypothetical protein
VAFEVGKGVYSIPRPSNRGVPERKLYPAASVPVNPLAFETEIVGVRLCPAALKLVFENEGDAL